MSFPFAASVRAMSKVGRTALRVPDAVSVSVATVSDTPHLPASANASNLPSGRVARVNGPLGSLVLPLAPCISLAVLNNGRRIDVSVSDPTDRRQRAMWGTTRRLLENLVTGVSEAFTVPVRLVGVGYRAALESVDPSASESVFQQSSAAANPKSRIVLKLGHSHPIVVNVPDGVEVSIPTPQRLILRGIDLAVVTQLAANIRKHRKPEPYNQKGVFVGDETIKKKEGKKR
ncbi:hypothetical protein HDU84_005747 [Entophlyctis sp. JEL0112]|nr:hypothetical protein HDU84_005747 [Entophlyctis sp. JEL0112]